MSEPVTEPAATEPEPSTEEPAQEPAEIDWKAKARDWERRAKESHAKLKEAEPILNQWKQLEESAKTDLQRAQEQTANWQTRAEQLQASLVSSRIEALAVGEFADPSDAIAALDPSKYLGLEGDIDEARIKADLAAVLEKKPHWRRAEQAPPGPRAPAPNPAQGSGASGVVPTDPAHAFAATIQGLLNRSA